MQCIQFTDWWPHILGLVFTAGMAIGFSLRLGIDYSELAAYRRIARQTEKP